MEYCLSAPFKKVFEKKMLKKLKTKHYLKIFYYLNNLNMTVQFVYQDDIWELVVTSTQNHWIILLFNIVKIFNKFKKFENLKIWKFVNQKFTNNLNLRKQEFLSVEKISVCICFVNKDVLLIWLNNCLDLEQSLLFISINWQGHWMQKKIILTKWLPDSSLEFKMYIMCGNLS